jgi:hypothetical protein
MRVRQGKGGNMRVNGIELGEEGGVKTMEVVGGGEGRR